MTRGTVVIYASKKSYASKPRPGVIVQASDTIGVFTSLTIVPTTTTMRHLPLIRVPIPETAGLSAPSYAMVDKIGTVPKSAVAEEVGHVDWGTMVAIDDALRRWLEL